MPVTRQGTNDAMTPESIQAMINWAIQRNSTQTQDEDNQNSGGGIRRPVHPARVCQGKRWLQLTLSISKKQVLDGAPNYMLMKSRKDDKYVVGLPDNILETSIAENKRKFANETTESTNNFSKKHNVNNNQRTITCYECGNQGHFRSDCPMLKNQGTVAYKLELPQQLSRVRNMFHMSNMKKYLSDESLVIPLKELRVDDKLHFVEEPIEVMDREIKQLKMSRIPIIKVRWNSKRGPEFTWERKDQFKQKYPHLFIKTAPSSSAAS
ncbi:putative reverse transcriptase domain-containing protein [Tanacetum coccineum]